MNKYPDMDEMIDGCRKIQKPYEDIRFAIGVGRVVPMLGKKKIMREAMDYIKQTDGFIGVHPIDLWHNLLVYDTLNNAKGARNLLKAKGCQVGNVVPILVPRMPPCDDEDSEGGLIADD